MTVEIGVGRRERNRIRNRNEILEAAQMEFSINGYHDTSIQAIAVRADFAVGTLYQLFDTKENLYRELLIDYAEQARIRFTEALSTASTSYERLVNYVRAKGELFEDRIPLARLILMETMGTGILFKSGPKPELNMMYDIWHKLLAELFEEGIRSGEFRRVDAMGAAVTLEGMTNQFIYHWQQEPDTFRYERAVEQIEDLFLKPLRA
jgi:AcrR family transcriptional regulator